VPAPGRGRFILQPTFTSFDASIEFLDDKESKVSGKIQLNMVDGNMLFLCLPVNMVFAPHDLEQVDFYRSYYGRRCQHPLESICFAGIWYDREMAQWTRAARTDPYHLSRIRAGHKLPGYWPPVPGVQGPLIKSETTPMPQIELDQRPVVQVKSEQLTQVPPAVSQSAVKSPVKGERSGSSDDGNCLADIPEYRPGPERRTDDDAAGEDNNPPLTTTPSQPEPP